MILSRSQVVRLINLQSMLDKCYKALPPDDEEVICISCISAAIEEYIERFL